MAVSIPPFYLNNIQWTIFNEHLFIYSFYATGIFFVLPCIESYQKVDLRTITLGVPPQEVISSKNIILSLLLCHVSWTCQVLTKDSVTVSVDAVVYYRVSNATISVANVEDAHSSTRYIWRQYFKTEDETNYFEDFWLKQHWGIFWARKICTKFWAIEKASPAQCRFNTEHFITKWFIISHSELWRLFWMKQLCPGGLKLRE